MDPMVQFALGGAATIVIVFGVLWLFGGLDAPPRKEPPVAAE
ncbi:MAG: hypothetical protein NW203_04045 [Hyphomonadaceae bacterium]|nr:hypothetical protein [Hyphomonadaceae bacterium]